MAKLSIQEAHALLTKSAASGASRSYEWRMRQFDGVKRFLDENQADIEAALRDDLGKGRFEALGLELLPVFQEIEIFQKNLRQWMKPEFTYTPAFMAPATSEMVYEPFGTCVIFGAFNYPLTLTLMPMLGAFAAGMLSYRRQLMFTRRLVSHDTSPVSLPF
jgi:aldehyde dehydrogenase (NAD+)